MLQLSLNTYFHLICIITVFCCLISQLALVKTTLSWKELLRLQKIDNIYGLAAILVVVTGLLNWMVFGKGYNYYANNTLFIIKISLYILVGLLSIYPTVLFVRFKKRNKEEKPEQIEFEKGKAVRKIIITELLIMAMIPFLAELMANGIDV